MDVSSIHEVNIETVNTCTRRCTYCKFGLERRWEKKIMSREVLEKILFDLKAVNYSKLIGLFVNNEPLMDPRIVSFVEMTSEVLPAARSYLFTNGDLLGKDLAQKLFNAGLHKLFVSLHSLEHHERLKELSAYFGEKRISVTNFFSFDKSKGFHNRGGSIQSDGVNQTRFAKEGCCLPHRQVVLNPDGDVYLCCCDFYYDVVFDNVMRRSLVDIFLHDHKFIAIRERLARKGREGLVLCETCSVPPTGPPLNL